MAAAMAPEGEGRQGEGAPSVDPSWPVAARALVSRLQAQVAEQAKRHSEALEVRESMPQVEPDQGRLRRLQLEVEIRAREQEVMLAELEKAEQKIWEMSDASDRNAARLAASLSQLERNKETLDQTMEELEVSNNLLAAAQARALEQERLLGSERAKLARAGVGPDGLPRETMSAGGSVDQLFQELNPVPGSMVDLDSSPIDVGSPEAGAPGAPVEDRAGSRASSSRRLEGAGPKGPRVVVEEIEDDGGSWPVVTEPPTPLRPKRDGGDDGS
jgi:hypothetical protein